MGKLLGKKAKSDPLAFGWLDKMPFTDEDYGLIGGPQNGRQKASAGSGAHLTGGENRGKPQEPTSPFKRDRDKAIAKYKGGRVKGLDLNQYINEQVLLGGKTIEGALAKYKKLAEQIDRNKQIAEGMSIGMTGHEAVGLLKAAKVAGASGLVQQAKEALWSLGERPGTWSKGRPPGANSPAAPEAPDGLAQRAQAVAAKHKGKSSKELAGEMVDPIWDRHWGPGEGKVVETVKKRPTGDKIINSEIKHTTGGMEQAKQDFLNIPGKDITKLRDRIRGKRVKRAPDGTIFILRRSNHEQVEPWKSIKSKKKLATVERQIKPSGQEIYHKKLRYIPKGWDIIFRNKE